LDFYLKALQFDSFKALGALDEEIDAMKREFEKMKKLRQQTIQNVQECVQDFTNLMN
jgi:hypothetical protein